MNYEKKYKEALQRAIEAKQNTESAVTIKILEDIFSELKNEDERIRNRLIAMCQHYIECYSLDPYNADDYKEALAWLEKQGKKTESIEVRATGYWNVQDIEQKSAWSEEDEDMLNKTTAVINRLCAARKEYVWSVNTLNELFYWLKSLKDRVQQKVELTQLDKNILEATIAFVEQNNHFNCWGGVDKHTVLSALHSLRPYNTWKPSDEQMEILQYLCETSSHPNEKVMPILESLYQDLKKLKGE